MVTDSATRVLWGVFRSDTGQRVSNWTFNTEAQAKTQIQAWRERDARGKRQDISWLMPLLEPKPL